MWLSLFLNLFDGHVLKGKIVSVIRISLKLMVKLIVFRQNRSKKCIKPDKITPKWSKMITKVIAYLLQAKQRRLTQNKRKLDRFFAQKHSILTLNFKLNLTTEKIFTEFYLRIWSSDFYEIKSSNTPTKAPNMAGNRSTDPEICPCQNVSVKQV